MRRRIVFDTSTVVSALLFPHGRLAWLRTYWGSDEVLPLVSRTTIAELARVLSYRKFELSADDRNELMADYLPWCEVVNVIRRCPVICRDCNDQPFLDLAYEGAADILISGDSDLLALAGKSRFAIESPSAFRERLADS